MAKPTELDKKAKKTTHKGQAKIKIGKVEQDIEIITETTPNATGGYDTIVHLPMSPIGASVNE